MRLDIIVVNWNSREQLRECLETIPAACRDSFILSRVVVVDNGSMDGSADGLQNIPIPLTLVRNRENRGYIAASNQGARGSQADYLLFLNPDTRLFENSLATPLAFMERPENQNVGAASIQLVDEQGQVFRGCSRHPAARTILAATLGLDRLMPRWFQPQYMIEWDHNTNRQVDQPSGAFFLVRRPLFEALGGFDERFFVYFEDYDFSLRAKQAGWVAFHVAEAKVFHKGSGTLERVKGIRLFYLLRSRLHYAYKHFGWWSATAVLLATLFVEPFTRLVLAIVQRSGENVLATFGGMFRLYIDLPMIFRDIRRFGAANRNRISMKTAPAAKAR